MRVVKGFFPYKKPLPETLRKRVEHWRVLPRANLKTAATRLRYVVLDMETSGLNIPKDRILSIGGASVTANHVEDCNQLHLVLEPSRQEKGPAQSATPRANARRSVPEMLIDFLDFIGKAPLIAYHAPFEKAMLERALNKTIGVRRLPNPWLDLAWLLPAMFPDVTPHFKPRETWIDYFELHCYERYDTATDALVNAELFRLALRQAYNCGLDNFQLLSDLAAQLTSYGT